jgi:hypothetical protein
MAMGRGSSLHLWAFLQRHGNLLTAIIRLHDGFAAAMAKIYVDTIGVVKYP